MEELSGRKGISLWPPRQPPYVRRTLAYRARPWFACLATDRELGRPLEIFIFRFSPARRTGGNLAMNQIKTILGNIGGTILMLIRAFKYLPTLPRQFPRLIEQCYFVGYTSLPIVTILSFFIGSVLALQ